MDVFERCLQLDKPFALLMSNFWLNSVGPCRLFKDRELQLLMFDKRIQFDKGGGVPFGSSYYCHRLLPKQIVFEELAVCRNDYSRMHWDVDNLNRNIAEEDAGLSFGVVWKHKRKNGLWEKTFLLFFQFPPFPPVPEIRLPWLTRRSPASRNGKGGIGDSCIISATDTVILILILS